jgi:hypothetical protein
MKNALISNAKLMALHSHQEPAVSFRIVMLTDLQIEVGTDVAHLRE